MGTGHLTHTDKEYASAGYWFAADVYDSSQYRGLCSNGTKTCNILPLNTIHYISSFHSMR